MCIDEVQQDLRKPIKTVYVICYNEVDVQRLVKRYVEFFELFKAILPCSDDCNFPSTLCFDDIAFLLRSRNEKAEAYQAKA